MNICLKNSSDFALIMKILVVILCAFAAAFGQSNSPDSIQYQLKPVSAVDRTNFEISVNFKLRNNEQILVKLPTDYYGTPSLHKFVTSFEGVNGTILNHSALEVQRF